MESTVQRSPDPADWIIEKFSQMQPAWHNSRITYRLKYWDASIKRYEFIHDYFWLNNAFDRLKREGVQQPEQVQIVELDE